VVTNTSLAPYEAAALHTPIVLFDRFDELNPVYAGYRYIHTLDDKDDRPAVLCGLLAEPNNDDRPPLLETSDTIIRMLDT